VSYFIQKGFLDHPYTLDEFDIKIPVSYCYEKVISSINNIWENLDEIKVLHRKENFPNNKYKSRVPCSSHPWSSSELIFISKNNLFEGMIYWQFHDTQDESTRRISFSINSSKREYLDNICEYIISEIEKIPDIRQLTNNSNTSFRLWSKSLNYNPTYRTLNIEKCPFSNIASNYTEETRKHLQHIMNTKNPLDYGKLIFWMGNPGTGKTWAIRSLMYEWRDIANFHIITDPNNFFSSDEYINNIFDKSDSTKGVNVIVLEDSPRLVLQETRTEEDCYKMSSFLNLTDGLWGAQKNFIFLVTTNDKIDDIDPAFLRDGRCLQRLKFMEFEKDEAIKWLKDEKIDNYEDNNLESDYIPLSRLYAIRNRKLADSMRNILDQVEQSSLMGFKI